MDPVGADFVHHVAEAMKPDAPITLLIFTGKDGAAQRTSERTHVGLSHVRSGRLPPFSFVLGSVLAKPRRT